MRLGHGPALALVGWYLMVPPLTKGQKTYDAAAPLQSWGVFRSFDSAAQCETYRASLLEERYRQPTTKEDVALQALVNWPGFRLQCVATDDPRLKEK